VLDSIEDTVEALFQDMPDAHAVSAAIALAGSAPLLPRRLPARR
jgi:hypothetical protein